MGLTGKVTFEQIVDAVMKANGIKRELADALVQAATSIHQQRNGVTVPEGYTLPGTIVSVRQGTPFLGTDGCVYDAHAHRVPRDLRLELVKVVPREWRVRDILPLRQPKTGEYFRHKNPMFAADKGVQQALSDLTECPWLVAVEYVEVTPNAN